MNLCHYLLTEGLPDYLQKHYPDFTKGEGSYALDEQQDVKIDTFLIDVL